MRRVGFKRRRTNGRKRPAQRKVRFGEDSVGTVATSETIYTHQAGANACTLTSIHLDLGVTALDPDQWIRYVLMHVPDGYNTPSAVASGDFDAEPAESILIAGQLNSANLQDHKWCRISKKFAEGDQLVLQSINSAADPVNLSYMCEFSILG